MRDPAPSGKCDQVVGATSFGTGTDGRLLPATEGLAANNCTGDTTVHVHVTRLHLGEPQFKVISIKRVQTSSQAVVGSVLQLNSLFKGVSSHNTQDRTEVLSHMVLRARLDAFTNAGAPQAAGLVQFLRLNQPTLTRTKGGQTAE